MRNTDIEQGYFEPESFPLAPTLAAPYDAIPACRSAVKAVVGAFEASPAHEQWMAAARQHQHQRRREAATGKRQQQDSGSSGSGVGGKKKKGSG